MANNDAAFGLRPHNKLGSNTNSSGTTAYKVQIAGVAGSSSAIYQGDMVIPLTNGLVDVSAADGGSVAILGVMNGCQYVNLQGEKYFELDSNGDDTSTELTITGESFGYNNPTGNSGTGFIDNDNTKKGIIEIIEDVKSLLYNKHKLTRFGLKNVDWQFNGVTDPTLTSLQPLLLSPYIEAKQINLRVNVIENRNVNQLGST